MENISYNDIYAPITAEEMAMIPAEMKAAARWICWGADKVPVSVTAANNGNHFGIDITKSANWGTFEQAAAAIGEPAYIKSTEEYCNVVGIGFVVGNGWFCIDMDGGEKHKKEDVPDAAIADSLRILDTYAETSLSGCGYHIFGKCDFTVLAENNKPHRGPDGLPVPNSYEVEFFTRRKFIAITGRRVSGSSESAKSCTEPAQEFYSKYIYTDYQKDEQRRKEERAKVSATIPVNADDATEMFLLNYPDILAASDSSNFKRGGKNVQLPSGCYSWIAAVKAMQEIGIPETDIIEWCRRGSNFKSERDVQRVLDKSSKPRAASVAGIIEDAKAHGWKPAHLTGEYKRKHEESVQRAAEKWNYNYELGPEASWDDEITTDYPLGKPEYIDPETGEILPEPPAQDPGTDSGTPAPAADPAQEPEQQTTETINGITIHTVQGAQDPEEPADTAPDPAAPWEPLNKRAALPEFPLDKLPGWIKQYIENFSENTGISKDFCAACVLGAVSTVVCGHLQVFFNGTHYEPVQLYAAFVGRSGSMKSTAVKQFVGPARAWLFEQNTEVEKHNSDIFAEIAKLEEKLIKAKKDMTKAAKDESPFRNDTVKAQAATIEEIKAQIELKKGTLKAQFPVPFSDVTPEALVQAARTTNGAITIATAEGNIINVLTGRSYNRQGGAPNLDIFLNGHDGEPFHNYRVTTGEVNLPRVDISMLIAAQPSLLETLCNSPDANGRGLLQRFLIFAPDDPNTFIDHTLPNSSNRKLAEKWNKHICAIAERIMQPDAANLTTLELDMFADKAIREFWNYESELLRQRGTTEEEGITGWISKLHGKALRLAAIITLLNDPEAYSISEENAKIAIDLLKEYFIPQYFASVGSIDNLSKEARQIVNWIIRHANSTGNRENFTGSELQQYVRQINAFKGKNGKDNYQAAMSELIGKNFIRPGVPEKKTRGNPARTWQINPEVFTH